MEIDVDCKSVVKIDINSEEAFRILVKTLNMDFILNEDYDCKLYVRENVVGELCVYDKSKGYNDVFDERGELYKALIATAKCIFINM